MHLSIMALSSRYGIADPMVSDIIKTLVLSSVAGVGTGAGFRLPTTGEVIGVSTSMGIYWYLVHPYLGDKPIEYMWSFSGK